MNLLKRKNGDVSDEREDQRPLSDIWDYWQSRSEEDLFLIKPDGDVLCITEQYRNNPRHFQSIVQAVEQELGTARLVQLGSTEFNSQVELDQQNGSGIPIDTSTIKVQDSAGVDNLNFQARDLLQSAISAGSSDMYIDIVGDSCTVSLRTYGLKMPLGGAFSDEQGFNICRAIFMLGENTPFTKNEACDSAFSYSGRRFRCSSLPGIRDGVGVVVRMRDPNFYLPLEACGYSQRQIDAIHEICESPGGLILVTGETNSGKSSTLATIMHDLPTSQKIIEISDPIEVEFNHVTQVEIPKHTDDDEGKFKKILSGLVRQNPDTLILGEMRDKKTADAGMSMALQGKRVLSTLHTQSCMLAFPRMKDLGVDESLLFKPGFIAGVINQNLIPRLCPECCQDTPSESKIQNAIGERHKEIFGDKARYANYIGCENPKCRNGMVGQTLVAEVYPMVRDRDGKMVIKLRDDEEKSVIDEFVQTQWSMESKQQHAWKKVIRGEVYAFHVERIIGRLNPETDSVYPE